LGSYRCVRGQGLAAIAAAAVLVVPASADAATTTLGFDDLAPGTEVTTHYLNAGGTSQGPEFGRFNGGNEGVRPQVEQVPAGQANSGTQVADIYQPGEFSQTETWATFPFQKAFVRVFVGMQNSGSTPVTLTAFGNDGDPLPNVGAKQTKTVTGGAGYKTMLEVSGPPGPYGQIKFIHVAPPSPIGGGTPILKIDDVAFDTPDPGQPPPPPDFGLDWTPTVPDLPFGVSKGKSASTQIKINRSNGSDGNITFSVDPNTQLPSGVNASFSPNPVSGTGSSVTMTLTASANAATVDGQKIKVIAKPAASAGTANRTVEIPVTVRLSDFDLLLTGIEVTQGIQRHEDVNNYYKEVGSFDVAGQTFHVFGQDPGSCGKAIPSLPARNLDDFSKSIDYSQTQEPAPGLFVRTGGVHLAQDKKTFARVYANVVSPTNGKVEDVPAVLYGSRNGKALPGSPLSPDNGVRDLGYSGRTFVNCHDRADPAGSYVFTLPDDWTSGDVDLTAKLLPPDVLFGPGGECGTADCAANNALKLADVDFTRTSYVTVTPVEMVYGGFGGADPEVRPPRPGLVFDDARTMTPSRLLFGEGSDDYNYAGLVSIIDEVSDMKQDLADADDDDERKEIRADTCSDILGRLEDWADDHPHGDLTVGVYQSVCPGVSDGGYNLLSEAEAFSVVEANRPRTSVAHEITHGFGRPHASKACGGGTDGQVGESWSPDEVGHMHGVGFDPRTLSPLVPKGILGFDSLGNGQPDEYHDYMSYCWTGENATWNSDRGWNDSLIDLYAFQRSRGRTSAAAATARGAPAAGRLRVIGATNGTTADILKVKPAVGAAARSTPGSEYQLVARDAAGAVLASVAMRAIQSHVDGLGLRILLRADVPAAGVASVEIVKGGQVLARRARSANAPKVTVLAPKRGARVGRRRTVRLLWRASDADGDKLTAKVDYSSNGGQSFRTIFSGPSAGRVDLPSALFSGTRRARVRVRVSDGFNEGSARSAAFAAVGHRPRVAILSPRRGARIMGDARLYLEGSAYDDAGRRLQGRRLQWFAGRKRLGSGETLSAVRVPAGKPRIRLVARDRSGRAGSASVRIRVIAAAPQFLRLDSPSRLGARAKRVVLRVASTLPATLRVGGRRFRLTRRTKRVTLVIRPGAAPLSLGLALRAGGRTTRMRLVIPRA
jgi:hypothetical protein